jgi:hypothetical protein
MTYGCHNKTAAAGHWMKDGHIMAQSLTGVPISQQRMRFVPFRNTRECGYDKRLTDERCKGCSHGV